MKTFSVTLFIALVAAGAAVAQGCSHPGLDPAEACPVGTLYNPDSGACDTVIS